MNVLKWMLAGMAVGVILVAFRDFENETWLIPARGGRVPGGGGDRAREAEPFLGYDGMDEETLLDWLDHISPDPGTLARIRDYEAAHRGREAVLEALDDLR